MSTSHRLICTSALIALLAGCGSESHEEAAPPEVKDTAFGDMVGTMDKARGVEDTIGQQKRDTDEQLDKQERGE
jgi:hypothetical protein